MDSGRAAGWSKLTAEQMTLLKTKFVPYAPRWGSTGYTTQDAWIKEVSKKAAAIKHQNRIPGTFWSIITASGEPVVSPKQTLEGALEAFARMPEKDRQPAIEDRGPHDANPSTSPDQTPSPGTMFVQVYCRPLERGPEGSLRAARTIDLTEFGGRPGGNSMQSRFSEPQREWLWLTETEAQALAPGKHRKGETYAFPA